jgi:hypothetical protein
LGLIGKTALEIRRPEVTTFFLLPRYGMHKALPFCIRNSVNSFACSQCNWIFASSFHGKKYRLILYWVRFKVLTARKMKMAIVRECRLVVVMR